MSCVHVYTCVSVYGTGDRVSEGLRPNGSITIMETLARFLEKLVEGSLCPRLAGCCRDSL